MLYNLFAVLSGALFCNAVPHLVSGLQGRRFPTPFARPPGRGLSPAWLNFVWGFGNLVGAVALAWRPLQHPGSALHLVLVLAGAALAGLALSVRFAGVEAGSKPS